MRGSGGGGGGIWGLLGILWVAWFLTPSDRPPLQLGVRARAVAPGWGCCWVTLGKRVLRPALLPVWTDAPAQLCTSPTLPQLRWLLKGHSDGVVPQYSSKKGTL